MTTATTAPTGARTGEQKHPSNRRELCGTVDYPLTDRIRDGIAVHGLSWAVRYYSARLPRRDARLMLRFAYCGAAS